MENIKERTGVIKETPTWDERKASGEIMRHGLDGASKHGVGSLKYDGTRIPRNVLTIASEGFPGAHFATFPRALPEWCIKAATSEKGCCPECGSPWVRVVDVAYDNPGNRTTNGPRSVANRDITAGFEQRLEKRTNTIGWERACKCGVEHGEPPYTPVPCRILDPFGGAGTTGLAAIGLQRHCTLIELASDYCEQSVKRLRNGLHAKSPKRQDAPGQLSLFAEPDRLESGQVLRGDPLL